MFGLHKFYLYFLEKRLKTVGIEVSLTIIVLEFVLSHCSSEILEYVVFGGDINDIGGYTVNNRYQ